MMWSMESIAFFSMNLAERSYHKDGRQRKAKSLPFETGCPAKPSVAEGGELSQRRMRCTLPLGGRGRRCVHTAVGSYLLCVCERALG